MADADRSARLLQQFARLPVLGEVKTRLARGVGAEAALAVHRLLVERTGRMLADAALAPVELWLDRAGEDAAIRAVLDRGVRGPLLQRGEDLGERMFLALEQGLKTARSVILVGSDCPGLDRAYLRQAFEALEQAELVLGPAEDGGYVLIGVRSLERSLFNRVRWGGGEVLSQTLANAEQAGMKTALVEERYDIDEPHDLQRWCAADLSVSLRNGRAG